jgi:hypothetical protein
VDRRVALLIPIVLAGAPGCRGARRAAGPRPDANPLVAPLPEVRVSASARDASVLDAEPLALITGSAAELEIGNIVASAAPDETLQIRPGSVGPYRISMSRSELARELPPGVAIVDDPPAPARPSLAHATIPGLLVATVYAGRVSEVDVFGTDPRAKTDRDVAVGATLGQVEDAYGDVRVSGDGRGWVATDLPGVIFVPGDPTFVAMSPPPALATIRHVIVVGPEAD